MYDRWMPHKLKVDDVFLTSEGPLGSVAFMEKNAEYCLGQRLYALRANSTLLQSRFLFYLMQSYPIQKQLFSRATGSTVKGIRQSELVKIQVYIPPLDEQEVISRILTNLYIWISLTSQMIELNWILKKGLMQYLMTQGIGHTRFKKTKIGEIPESWDLIPLAQAAFPERNSFVDGPFGSSLKVSDQTEEGIRLIMLQNIGEGEFQNEHKRYTSETKFQELKRHAAYPGDVVIAKMAHPVARACLIPHVEDRFLVLADCIRLKVNPEEFDSRFVVYAINSTPMRKQAVQKSTGSTRLRIGLTSLKTILIPKPPMTEQRKINQVLSLVDISLKTNRNQSNYLEYLKKGLMQVLLTGKVRVRV